MKKILTIISFISATFCCEAIWDNGPTQLLQDIFKITETQGVETLETAIEQSKFKWIRPKKLELWHAYSILDNTQRCALIKKIKDSDLAKEKMPKKQHYDVVIVLGAATSRVKARIEFLLKLYKMGIAWDKVYLLGSTRNLKIGNGTDQQIARILESNGISPTEIEMVKYIWQETEMPESLRAIPIQSIQADAHSDGTRAELTDTLAELLKVVGDVQGKNFLFIANNPFICFLDAEAKRALEKSGVNVETVGEEMKAESMENVLDAVVRCLINMQRP